MPVSRALVLLPLLATCSFGAVAFDNSASTTGYPNPSLSWNHTVGTAVNRGILVYIATQPVATDIVTGVMVGSSPMRRLSYCAGAGAYLGIYAYWLASPPSGSQTISVSFTQTYWYTRVASVSYSGTSQYAPTNVGCSSAARLAQGISFAQSVTTTLDNSWVVGCANNDQGDSIVALSGTTLRESHPGLTAEDRNGSTSPAGSATLGVSAGGTASWSGIALELQSYTAPPPAGSVSIL